MTNFEAFDEWFVWSTCNFFIADSGMFGPSLPVSIISAGIEWVSNQD